MKNSSFFCLFHLVYFYTYYLSVLQKTLLFQSLQFDWSARLSFVCSINRWTSNLLQFRSLWKQFSRLQRLISRCGDFIFCSFFPHCLRCIHWLLPDQVWGQDFWILAKFFFCVFAGFYSHFSLYVSGWLTNCLVRMAGYWPSSLFCKNKIRPIFSQLDRISLVNEWFIIWLSERFFLRNTAGSPERER